MSGDVIEVIGTTTCSFYCPGCECLHAFWVAPHKPAWNWDGDKVKPSVTPSIRVNLGCWPGEPKDRICHFFIAKGKIVYCNDCTHALNGKTVDMIPVATCWDDEKSPAT